MEGCMMEWKGCGRIDPHPGHHWYGHYRHPFYDAFGSIISQIRPVYWCKGEFIVEGGSPHGNPLVADTR